MTTKGGDIMQDDKKIKVSIYLDNDLHTKIKKLAADDERSVNSLMVKLLKDYVKDSEK